jgi:hypothetical protein
MIGKNGGEEILGVLKYFSPRCSSYLLSEAFAGRVQGGLFPEPTLMPPRKMGCTSMETLCLVRDGRSFLSLWRAKNDQGESLDGC